MKYVKILLGLTVLVLVLIGAKVIFLDTKITNTSELEGGQIILGNVFSQSLSKKEQMILESVIPEGVRRSVAEGFGTCYLKYFDAHIALAGCAEGKPGSPISAYKISENNRSALLLGRGGELNTWGGYYES